MADGSQAGHPVVSRTSGQTILVASPHILTGHILTVGLGAVAAVRPLGPIQLHNLFLVGMQEPGQPGAVAASALDRPHPLPRVLVGELQELPVAGWGSSPGRGGQGLAAARPEINEVNGQHGKDESAQAIGADERMGLPRHDAGEQAGNHHHTQKQHPFVDETGHTPA